MKVLLISANTEAINMPVLPLGMAYVAAAAENAGHEVKTVNLMMEKDISRVLETAVARFSPEVVGISVRNIDDQMMENPRFLLDPVKSVVVKCRKLSDAPIVLGGAGYSIFPQRVLDYLKADMGVQGEGEHSFVMLLERMENKANLSGIPGLCLPASGLQEKGRFAIQLDDHPPPLPNIHLILPTVAKDEETWLPIQTRRGCPMDCNYCSTATIEGRVLRKHSIGFVVEFIRRYKEAGLRRFFFVDNTFNFPLSYAKALCDQMIAEELGITWRAILYPWKVDDELLEKMVRAGCKEVALGFESGSQQILKRLNKRFTPDDVRRTSQMLGKQGIHRMGFLLLGGPGETRESVEESLHFADSLKTEAMKITVGIRIYPHTSLHRTAVDEGVVSPDENLLRPKFYMARGLRSWLDETVTEWMAIRPNWMR